MITRLKKVTIIFLAILINIGSLTSCSKSSKIDVIQKEDETSAIEKTDTETTTFKEVTEEITIVDEEETTTETAKPWEEFKWEMNSEIEVFLYGFVPEKINTVKEIFNGKEFHYGDVINVKEEMDNLGYNISEDGDIFTFIYSTLDCGFLKRIKFEDIEADSNLENNLLRLDENHNIIIKNITEKPFKMEVDLEDGNVFIIRLYLLEE